MIWFTSDTHFGHHNIITYAGRPFVDINDMERELVRRWNGLVEPQDTVYHLGDISFEDKYYMRDIWRKLNGEKFIVRGNHDRSNDLKFWMKEGVITGWTKYFDFVDPDTDVHILLAHVPMFTHEPHLCGHVHTQWRQQRRTINVGVDQWDWKPVPLTAIRERLQHERFDPWKVTPEGEPDTDPYK